MAGTASLGKEATGWRLISGIGLLIAALPLLWFCLSEVLADRGLVRNPDAALIWAPARAGLMALAAEDKADNAKAETERAAADSLARRALAREPLENRALRVLALDADRRGAVGAAYPLMTALGGRTLRDTQVQLWLAERALTRRGYQDAFQHMNVVLRRDPSLSAVLFPAIGDALGAPEAMTALVGPLATAPDWRSGFVSALVNRPDGTPLAKDLLLRLNRTPAPATEAEIGQLVSKIAEKDDRGARETWLQFLPTPPQGESRLLYDGGFKGLPGPPPFNWRLGQQQGVLAEKVQAPDGRTALQVQYPASKRRTLAEQRLALAPGAYRLTGETMADPGEAPIDLTWTLACDDDTVLAEAPIRRQGAGWRRFGVDFVAPRTGCTTQWLSLTNTAQDSFATAQAWFSRMAIAPGEAARTSEGAP